MYIYTVLRLFYTRSLFEEEISRMNPQAIVPPQPLQPPPTVGEYVYVHVMPCTCTVYTFLRVNNIFIQVYTVNNNRACLILHTLSCIVLLKLLRICTPPISYSILLFHCPLILKVGNFPF